MTGAQDNPATGRTLEHEPTNKLSLEGFCRALGVANVDVLDVVKDEAGFEKLLRERLAKNALSVLIARKPCILAAPDIRRWEEAGAAKRAALQAPVDCSSCVRED